MDVDWVETHLAADEDEAFLHLFNLADRDDVRKTHEEIVSTINTFGGNVLSYRRKEHAGPSDCR